jgi:hypothetical protein
VSRLALIRLGPCATVGLINSGVERRLLYDSTGIRRFPHRRTNVVVDHNKARPVGEVLDLFEMDDTVPAGVRDARWLVARCRIDDDAPAWLKRGTGASISFCKGFESTVGGWPIIRSGWLNEVTVCSPAHKPVEPLAQVMLLRVEEPGPVQSKPAQSKRQPQLVRRPAVSRAQKNASEMAELHRRIDAAGPGADVEAIIVAMQLEMRGRLWRLEA